MRYHLFLLSFPLFMCSCSTNEQTINNDLSNVVIPETDHEYFEVSYITINWSDILIQNKTTYYVYIYSLTCSHCQEMKNWIITQALNRDDVFFVKGTNSSKITTDISSSIGATSTENITILGYPSMLKIKNKTVVENVAGKANIMSLL